MKSEMKAALVQNHNHKCNASEVLYNEAFKLNGSSFSDSNNYFSQESQIHGEMQPSVSESLIYIS